MNEMEKLQILLGHWIEHNEEHGEEFEGWAQRAAQAGLEEVSAAVSEAAHCLQEATRCLRQALTQLEAGEGSYVPE